jgi:hypothetical protein
MRFDIEENLSLGVYNNTVAYPDAEWKSQNEATKDDVTTQLKKRREESNKIYATFMVDLEREATACGVPSQYAKKVAEKAYEEGHSNGYEDVLAHLYSLVELFEAKR